MPRPGAGEGASWLKASLNGARRPGDRPALPATPLQLAEAAREAREAGADAGYLHPRDEAGSGSLSAAHIGAAVRAACPGLPVPGPRLLHGAEEPTWILLDEAGQLGLATRIGLEDVLHNLTGDQVSGNSELVRLARARLT